MARRVSMLSLSTYRGFRAAPSRAIAMQGVWLPDLGHRGDGPPSHSNAADPVVLGSLSGDDPHAGPLGSPAPAAAGDRPLRHRLGPPSQTPSRYGATRPGAPEGEGGSGRELCRGNGKRAGWTATCW